MSISDEADGAIVLAILPGQIEAAKRAVAESRLVLEALEANPDASAFEVEQTRTVLRARAFQLRFFQEKLAAINAVAQTVTRDFKDAHGRKG